LKEKIEYQKITRKYSPEVDLGRALIQTKQRPLAHDYTSSNPKINAKRNQLSSSSNHAAFSEVNSTRGNSTTNQKHT
jgi:hypothetical protein